MITWFEIPATDIDRAIAFYSKLFQIDLVKMDCGTEQMAFFPEDFPLGGMISKADKFNPSRDGIILYFDGGENMEEKLKIAADLGGEIVRPKTKIDNDNGYFSLVLDSEGNRIGFYSK